MSEIKLCKDCKHSKAFEQYYSYSSRTYQTHLCNKENKIQIDLVNGHEKYNDDISLTCYEQRAEISHVQNRCGKEAKYFEAK